MAVENSLYRGSFCPLQCAIHILSRHWYRSPAMQTQVCEKRPSPKDGQNRSGDWMHHVIALLNSAIGHLHQGQAAHGAIVAASSLLRRQVGSTAAGGGGSA